MSEQIIYLLRHGETKWTVTGQHTSITDLPLTENGVLEAKALAKSLEGIAFDHVFCSPLLRARETCKIAGFSRVAHYDDALFEWRYGAYEGKTSQEICKEHPGWNIFTSNPPGGETAEEIRCRIDAFLAKIKPLKGAIALFSSGHISRALAARWVGCPVSFGKSLILSTASKSILSFEHGHPAIALWNDTSHLYRK